MSRAQEGGGALMMVLMLMSFSAALLHANHALLSNGLNSVIDEQRFMIQMTDASSALAWGLQQQWADHDEYDGWQCQVAPQQPWRACLGAKESTRELLRGDSGTGTLAWYRWVGRHEDTRLLRILAGGWIDFCPLANEEACLPNG